MTSGGSAHLGGEEEMAMGGGIFSTGHRFYRWRRQRRPRQAPWVGDECQCRAGPANKRCAPGSPASGGRCVGLQFEFESGASRFGLTAIL
jgi:hypothetical protein